MSGTKRRGRRGEASRTKSWSISMYIDFSFHFGLSTAAYSRSFLLSRSASRKSNCLRFVPKLPGTGSVEIEKWRSVCAQRQTEKRRKGTDASFPVVLLWNGFLLPSGTTDGLASRRTFKSPTFYRRRCTTLVLFPEFCSFFEHLQYLSDHKKAAISSH